MNQNTSRDQSLAMSHEDDFEVKKYRVKRSIDTEIDRIMIKVNQISGLSKDEVISVLIEANDLIFKVVKKL